MCTKCVSILALTAVEDDFQLNLKNVIGVIRRMMCTKCVLTVSPSTIDTDFS